MNRSRLPPPIIQTGWRPLGGLRGTSRIFQGASLLPKLRRLDQIIDTVHSNYSNIIEIGREARQAGTDVRAGHRGQPAKLAKLALTNLKFLIIQGSGAALPG